MDEFDEDVAGHKRTRTRRVRDIYSSESEEDSDIEAETQSEDQENKTDDKGDDNGGNDSDMFASDDEENIPEEVKGSEKKSNILDIKRFNKEAEIEDENVEAEEQIYDDYDKIQDYYNNMEEGHVGHKCKLEHKIEAFNLKNEEEEGHFDNDGHFIREKESEDENWVSSIKKSDIVEARKAQELREAKLRQKLHVKETTAELIALLLELLEPDETPIEALARFAPKKSKKTTNEDDTHRKQVVIEITDTCSKLSNAKGIHDAFELTREELMRKYSMETGHDYSSARGVKRSRDSVVDEEKHNNDAYDNEEYGDKVWEYRWLDEQDVNGPFSGYEMNYWKDTYFNNSVEVRKIGEPDFKHIDEVTFYE